MTKNKVKGGKSASRPCALILSKDLASKTLTGFQNYVNSCFFSGSGLVRTGETERRQELLVQVTFFMFQQSEAVVQRCS